MYRYALSNRDISDDLEWPLKVISVTSNLVYVVTLCAQLTRDLLAIAKFLVCEYIWAWRTDGRPTTDIIALAYRRDRKKHTALH